MDVIREDLVLDLPIGITMIGVNIIIIALLHLADIQMNLEILVV
jgi:hypothetical protein